MTSGFRGDLVGDRLFKKVTSALALPDEPVLFAKRGTECTSPGELESFLTNLGDEHVSNLVFEYEGDALFTARSTAARN